jgi:Flp pilus assembly protein TadG
MDWSSLGRMKRWLLQENEEPRRAPRNAQPEVVVYYWDGSAPEGRQLRDISQSGAYIYTPERWYPGTIIRIILQGYQTVTREDGTTAPQATTCIPARVIRQGADGVAVEFAFRDKKEEESLRNFLAAIPAPPARAEPTKVTLPVVLSQRQGQSLVEFALIIPLVLLLAVNAVNFGGFLYAWITVANAARAGAQYMTLSSASPGPPTPATLAQITTLVTNDVTSLLNRASVVVAICTNKTAAANGCTTLTDPEEPAYTLATVDVTYTYKPFIPLFSFPKLGIGATLPTTSLHRKAVMRMLQ